MRKKIAEHMVLSKRTSAHVYSVFEVNYSKVDEIRKARRADYEQRGVKLTFTSFIAKVAIDALRRHKVINASIDGDNVVYKREINLGIAVALENGLDRAGGEARRRAQHPRAFARRSRTSPIARAPRS